ncbi:MAG: hypothetical protein ACRCWI_06140 [Brevinema sp.]
MEAMENFWNQNPPTKGSKDLFQKYWTISHEYVKFHGISTYAKKTEICDIKYLIHYMGQGALSDEYAIKAVEMTKAIMANKLTCDTDDSLKLIIEPSTIYVFKSINKDAQTKFIELMLEVKNQMGTSFEKFEIASGFRGPVIHAHTVIKDMLLSKRPKNYYGKEPTRRYCNALADIYNGDIPNWTNIDEEAKLKILTIPKGNIEKAVDIAIELMNDRFFEGTDHRGKNALDFTSNSASYKLQLLADKDKARYYTYSDKLYPIKGMQAHVHITINK